MCPLACIPFWEISDHSLICRKVENISSMGSNKNVPTREIVYPWRVHDQCRTVIPNVLRCTTSYGLCKFKVAAVIPRCYTASEDLPALWKFKWLRSDKSICSTMKIVTSWWTAKVRRVPPLLDLPVSGRSGSDEPSRNMGLNDAQDQFGTSLIQTLKLNLEQRFLTVQAPALLRFDAWGAASPDLDIHQRLKNNLTPV